MAVQAVAQITVALSRRNGEKKLKKAAKRRQREKLLRAGGRGECLSYCYPAD